VQSEPEHNRVGEVIDGKWTLERLIGVGGMAAVYAARHRVGTTAAIKILHPQYARLTDLRRRFEREALVMGRLEHPSTVEVRDIDVTEDGSPYIVMELLEGRPLSQCMKEGSGVSVPEMLSYADQTLAVLIVAHEQGIVHRDIKPDNLFVTQTGQLKVLDFGIARMLETSGGPGQAMTAAGTRLGTLPYMPPEQVLGADIDGRADLFALGAVMYKVMARRRVHECSTETELLVKMAKDPASPLCEVAPQIPVCVGQVVDCALAVRRDERYPNARSMQGDVQAVLGGRRPANLRVPSRASLSAADTAALTATTKAVIPAGAPSAVSGTEPTVIPGGTVSPLGPTVVPAVSGTGPTMVPAGAEVPTRIEGLPSGGEAKPAARKQKTDPLHVPPEVQGTLLSASAPQPAAPTTSAPTMVSGPVVAAPAQSQPQPILPPADPVPPAKESSGVGKAGAIALAIGVAGVLGAWALFGPEDGAAATEETSGRSSPRDDDDDGRRYAPVDLEDEGDPTDPTRPAGSHAPEPNPAVVPSTDDPDPKWPEPRPEPPPMSEKARKKLEKERDKERKKAEKARKKAEKKKRKRGKD